MSNQLKEMNPSALTERELIAAPADEPLVTARCRVLVANGRHNAFPTIARWRGAYWIAYREGDAHAGPGQVVVLRSTHGAQWEPVQRIHLMADNRDAQFVVQGEDLWLYIISVEAGLKRTFAFTADAEGRFQPRGQIYRDGDIFWRPITHGGRFYCAAYTSDGGEQRTLTLIASADGVAWEKVSDMGTAPGRWSETCIRIDEDQRMSAFLRFKYSHTRPDEPCLAQVWEADPPYTQWRRRATLPFRIEGPGVADFQGRTFLFTRGFNAIGSANAMNVHLYDPTTAQTTPYCSIPTMRDSAYGQAVQTADGAQMLLVFYCTAPDGVNLYLAEIPLPQ